MGLAFHQKRPWTATGAAMDQWQSAALPLNPRAPYPRAMHLPQAKLDAVLDRFREVEARMGAASDGAEIVRLGKEHAELRPVAEAVAGLVRARDEREDLFAMTAD